MNAPTVRYVSESFIKPKYSSEESKQPYYLGPWDLAMLSAHYIQKGLLFPKPPAKADQARPIKPYLDKLKQSLSLALLHFYPLAGRLTTRKAENPPSYVVFIDCSNGPGAKFVHAALDMTMHDVVSPIDVPLVVQALFDHDRAVNHDGHTLPLLTVQVTELLDGVFIGCSLNHVTADGTSFWHFFNTWSEIFKAHGENISVSRPPIHQRWFPDGYGPIIGLPFAHHDEFVSRFEAPQLRERIFHFSSESMAKLKAKANTEWNTTKISSFQALSALMWRCITRARGLPRDQTTNCKLAINNRSRLDPPLSQDFFGNSIQTVSGTTTAGELLEQSLGWAAWLLHDAVVDHTNEMVRRSVDAWFQSPKIYELGRFFDPHSIMMGSSPRFDMYGNEFGLGKAVAIRSGYANKFDGKVSSYPGYEGGGSVDLEACLRPQFMLNLESDREFMEAVSEFDYKKIL